MQVESSSSGSPGDPSAGPSSSAPPSNPPTILACRKRKTADDASFEDEPKSKKPKRSPEETAYKTATSWLQQTWVQAVALDTTFMRFVSMNWEMVGLRCGKTRTLYLTRLQPHKPGTPFYDEYGKIQIAFKINIASLIDWRESHPEGVHGEEDSDGDGAGEE
ncbi:hypothetical protein DFH07DRAFT_1061611, partial [Mycena maculata]